VKACRRVSEGINLNVESFPRVRIAPVKMLEGVPRPTSALCCLTSIIESSFSYSQLVAMRLDQLGRIDELLVSMFGCRSIAKTGESQRTTEAAAFYSVLRVILSMGRRRQAFAFRVLSLRCISLFQYEDFTAYDRIIGLVSEITQNEPPPESNSAMPGSVSTGSRSF
jgi:hypothetical protein